MGQQQLLLIVFGVIVIGIAIVIGMQLFRANSINSKRDLLVTECTGLATKAIDYYKRPKSFGGGNRSFLDWQIPAELDTTENGRFNALVSAESVIITGTGNEVLTGSDTIKVQVIVSPNSTTTSVIN